MFKHHLPSEEGPSAHITSNGEVGKKVQIVCGPYASNLDEFALLQQSTTVSWIRHTSDFNSPDLLILPGSKNSAGDIAWMRENGIDVEIQNMAHMGVPILGICGGMQILGQEITDDAGIESPTSTPGLGLLNLTTQFASKKEVRKKSVQFPKLPTPWEWLSDSKIDGYEIHFGESLEGTLAPIVEGGLAYMDGNIMATYIHGIFENNAVLKNFSPDSFFDLDGTLDLLSDEVIKHIDTAWLEEFIPLLKEPPCTAPLSRGH